MADRRSKAKKENMVPLEEAKDQVRKVCVRLALLHYAFTKTLVDELGEEKGRQLAMNAIKVYSERIGKEARKRVETEGLPNSAENYKEDLPWYGMHDGADLVQVEGEWRIRAFGCVMGKVWRELGVEPLGRIYCYVDPAKYMAYNPDLKLVHCKAMPDGDDYCELAVRPTTKKEKVRFAAKNANLASIDG